MRYWIDASGPQMRQMDLTTADSHDGALRHVVDGMTEVVVWVHERAHDVSDPRRYEVRDDRALERVHATGPRWVRICACGRPAGRDHRCEVCR